MAGPNPTAHDLLGQVRDPKGDSHVAVLGGEMNRPWPAPIGWEDLDLGHGFYETAQGLRFILAETARREVLDRLPALNHERYPDARKSHRTPAARKLPAARWSRQRNSRRAAWRA